MLGDLLPDLMLLALVLAFLLRRNARLILADRARVVSAAALRSNPSAACTGLRRCLSCASALATPADRATYVAAAPRRIQGVEPCAPSDALHKHHPRATVLPPPPEKTHDGRS